MRATLQWYLVCAVLFLLCVNVMAAPTRLASDLSAQCDNDDELLDLCQRCAKLTRSPLALGACCSRDLLARSFCVDYVYFARPPRDFY